MNKLMKKIKDNIISIALIAVLTYLTIINNLYKFTGENDWDIFHSPALRKLATLTIVFVIVVLLVRLIRKKNVK